MILKPGETCTNSDNCPYNKTTASYCQGTNPARDCQFTCNYVDDKGNFSKTHNEVSRNIHDITGKMEIIQE